MTRRSTGFLGLLPALVVVLAACNAAATASPSAASPSAVASAAGGGAGASGAAALTAPELVGTAWLLGDLPGQVLNDVRPTISFSGEGTVTGDGGCNTFNGTYTTSGANLTFGPLATTRKTCGDAVDKIEQAYLAALQATTAYEITSDAKLKLTAGATTLTYSVQQ
jgi:heat shock protein HslJ